MNVIIYADPGSEQETVTNMIETVTPILSPHYSITRVSSPEVFATQPWQSSTALVIIPGGRDLLYCRSLNGRPNAAISSWVRYQGGKFLGVCAGGYFGSKRCEFAVGDHELEVVGDRELSFFPGTCRGPVFPGFSYNKESGAKAAGLTIEAGLPDVQADVKVYCNGGGIFVDADSLAHEGVDVLARYQDKVEVEGGDAAAVFCKIGAGAAVLLGVHPEIRAAQLNKTDGDADFVDLIDDLLAHDTGRDAFLRAIFVKLGLKISSEDDIPHERKSGKVVLTPLHISSTSETLNRAIYDSLLSIADNQAPIRDVDTFTITGPNDTFQVRYVHSPLDSIQNVSEPLMANSQSKSVDPDPKVVLFHSTPATYTYFSSQLYFENLASSSVLGRSIAYVEVTTSTQTLLAENPSLLRSLPNGFVITATSQLKGRGRAGNAWISPLGILSFSFILRLPQRLSTRLVFMNYLSSLAVVEAIRTYGPGWEDVNVKIKWPNDIYGKSRYADRWEKIGGAMINSLYFDNEYILVVGCGLNSMNPHPTTCLLNIMPENLTSPTQERLLASILSTFSVMYEEFLEKGFRSLEQKYYERWLHNDQIVAIEGGLTSGKIAGINTEEGGAGGLLIDEVNSEGQSLGKIVEVTSDGNSFDIMKGLIRRKR